MRRIGWSLVLLAATPAALGAPGVPPAAVAVPASVSAAVRFEENRGQFPDAVAFLARRSGVTMALDALGGGAQLRLGNRVDRVTFSMAFAGAAPVAPVAESALPSHSNYFIGRDPARWRSRVPHFARVRYRELYPAIDVVYHGERPGAPLEFDVVVRPGGNPADVRLRLNGAPRLDARTGDVELRQGDARLVLRAPELYQDIDGVRHPVSGRFRLSGDGAVGFDVGRWDQTRELTIDPIVIAYSSYVGGSGFESATDLAVDKDGMLYVVGQTMSTDFPTAGAPHPALAGGGDAYVLKVNPAVNGAGSLVYATYIGSTENDGAEAVAVDGEGRAHVAGFTHAGDFPVTTNAFKASFVPSGGANDDESDAFATILAADGASLTYSTFFGGDRDEEAMGIVPSGASEFYLAGTTDGGTFPTTTSAFDQSGQVRSAFVSVLNWSTNTLRYSTVYHANSGQQLQVRGLAVDGTGRAHITGLARGPGLPTPGGFQTTFPPDASSTFGQLGSFLAVFDPAQTGTASLVYGTYLGAGDAEDVATDAQARSVVVGSTSASGFPTTPGALRTACPNFVTPGGQNLGCQRDAFVMRIDPGQSGSSSLVRATRLGGTRSDDGFSVVVDGGDSVVVTGSTSSAGFPTANALEQSTPSPDGEIDAFVVKLSPSLAALGLVARLGGLTTPTGGGGFDQGMAVVVAPDGAVCAAGNTGSSDFPIRRGFDASLGGRGDAFVVKLGFAEPPCAEVKVAVLDGRDFEWEPPLELCVEWPLGGFGGFGGPGGFPRPCPPPECPECDARGPLSPTGALPSFLLKTYGAAAPVLGAGGVLSRDTRRPLPSAATLSRALGDAPLGRWYTASVRDRTQRVLNSRSSFVGLAQMRRAATEAMNALELDWRLGRASDGPAQEKSRASPSAKTPIVPANVEVTSGLPAWPSSALVRHSWPMATFRLPGLRGGSRKLELDVSWMRFPEGSGEYRVLAWNGRRYRSITPAFDPVRRVVSALVPIGERLVVVRLVPCRLLTANP